MNEIMGAGVVLLVMCGPAWIVFSAVAVAFACMLSSRLSRMEK